MNKTAFFLIFLPAIVLGLSPLFTHAHSGASVCLNINSTLKLRSTDNTSDHSVSHLQDFLRSNGFLKTNSTGYFGQMTTKAVRDFQLSEKLDAIGIVGPKTRLAIQRISCSSNILKDETKDVPQVEAVLPLPTISGATLVATAINIKPTPLTLPYKSTNFSKWKGSWGSVSNTDSGSLLLKSTESTSGAEAIFPDSKDWIDYKYEVNVNISNGDVTLLSRYVDQNNFIGCTFSANYVGIIERVNGKTQTMDSVLMPHSSPTQFFALNTNFTMKVKGRTVSCIAVGSQDNVTYTFDANHPLSKGGIGVSTWGIGGPTLELREVKVEEI